MCMQTHRRTKHPLAYTHAQTWHVPPPEAIDSLTSMPPRLASTNPSSPAFDFESDHARTKLSPRTDADPEWCPPV